MSGLLNSSYNGSTSNIPDSTARPFTGSFSAQSATAPGFHPSGGLQGLHNIHGSFNLQNMSGSLSSRNAAMGGIPSSGIQQPGSNLTSGRYASNNLPVALTQMSHGSGVTNRGSLNIVGNPAFGSSVSGVGGSLNGISSNSVAPGNRNSVPGMGVSPILGNAGPRLTNSIGNMVGGSNMGRSISSGGLNVSTLASRVNLAANNGSANLSGQGPNRLMGSMLQQAPQMIGMLGSSYTSPGGPLSQNQVQGISNALSSMAGGPQSQIGSMRKQGVGVSSIVQQTQEFSIQNEDFPALPGFKGANSDFAVDLHQKEQMRENVSIMQSQHFPMARSSGFSLGGTYPVKQQHASAVGSSGLNFAPGNSQDLLRLHGSDLFSSHGSYHSQIQNNGAPSIGLRPLGSPTPPSNMEAYEQFMQQYQHHNQSQFRSQQMSAVKQSYRDENLKSISQTAPDRFGMLGLLSVIRMNDPELSFLALGIDLTTLGLNLNSTENLYKTYGSPWSDEPVKGEPEYSIPSCYLARPPPPLHQGHFSKFPLTTLFYIFYSMPKDEMQLYAASELGTRGWSYHKELQLWLMRHPNTEPLVKSQNYERGSYLCFDPSAWDTIMKENFVLQYEALEKKPALP